jgi:hypothetical protein
MRAELYRPEAPEEVVAVAVWGGGRASIEPVEGMSEALPDGFDRILRPTPVTIDDPSLRRQGTHGEVVLQPGTLDWFRMALLTRCPALGLAVRFVSGVREGGWDPAAQYRTFGEQIDRLSAGS